MITEEIFEEYDCSLVEIGNADAVGYQITNESLDINAIIHWTKLQNFENLIKLHIHRLIAVLANGAKVDSQRLYTIATLLEFIENNYVQLTPSDKLDSVLIYVQKQCTYEGQRVELIWPEPIEIVKSYFTNKHEWWFYLNSAIAQGLIKKQPIEEQTNPYDIEYEYGLTVDGLTRLIKLNERKDTKQCFIAMAFTNDMFTVLESSIKPALKVTGFAPYVVSEQHQDSDKTINDAILAGIKKSRFTIADFTHHRGGVYFEAGYALGRGQKVIYCCREDEMPHAHFDIRNYQHIVWSDAEDLKKKLTDKIEAFILD